MSDPIRYLLILALALVIMALLEWRHALKGRRHWTFIRFAGGGSVQAPKLMTESQALDFCKGLGLVVYVDRERGFIFYRP